MISLTRPAYLPRNAPIPLIRYAVHAMMQQARQTPDVQYRVEARGWGHPARVIAPMFDYAPPNVSLPYEFQY